MRKVNKKEFVIYSLIFTMSMAIAFQKALVENQYSNESILHVFFVYLIFTFSGTTVLYFVLNRLFGTKHIEDFSEQIASRFNYKNYALFIFRAIGGAIIFGFLFGLAQVVISQFHIKGIPPYLMLNSILIGTAGGLGLIFLASLKKHKHNIATTFIAGFLGFGGGHYITSQSSIYIIYYDLSPPYWDIINKASFISSGMFAGLSFGILQKNIKWAFPFILAGIISLYVCNLFVMPIDNAAWEILVAIRPFDEYRLDQFIGKQMFLSYLFNKSFWGMTLGFIFGILVNHQQDLKRHPPINSSVKA